jgi:hypothetical protein
LSRLIAIDPGLRYCGVAIAERGNLVACALIANPDKQGRNAAAWSSMAKAVRGWALLHGPFDRARSETPQVYQPGHHGGKRIDPGDLLQLQGVVGALSMAFDGLETVQPYQWKGQLPKEVCAGRIMARLSPEEAAVLAACQCAPSLKHNVMDAVGIMLDAADRFKR